MTSGRRFELRRRLGSGSFGHVYLADMISTGGFRKEVALKMLRPGLGASSDAGRRLRDEARVLGRLRHRHIVKVDDLVHLDERWAMVMEYVPGLDLEALLQHYPELERRLPPRTTCQIVAAVASALDAAYNSDFGASAPLRLVHRDIKPSNIRLAPDGQLKVLDFGIARAEFEEREASTEQVRYGSIPYMSPERLLGEEETPAGDVYSLGSIFLELLTSERFGRAPLRDTEHDARREELVARVTALHPDPPELAELISQALRYEVEDRPSAAELAERAKELASRFGGPDLDVWARGLFEGASTTEGVPLEAEGEILRESSSGSSSVLGSMPVVPTEVETGHAPTIIPEPEELAGSYGQPPPGSAEHSEPSGGGSRLLLAIPALMAMVAVLAVGAVVLGGGEREVDPTPAGALEIPEGEGATAAGRGPLAEASTEATQRPLGSTAEVGADDAPAEQDATPAAAPAPTGTSTEAAVADRSPPAQSGGASAQDSRSGSSKGRATSAQATAASSDGATASSDGENTEDTPDTEPVAASSPTLRAVKFAAPGSSAIRARCGDVSASGTTSALLRNLPAGACSVEVDMDGTTHSTQLTVDTPRGFTCSVEEDSLSCR